VIGALKVANPAGIAVRLRRPPFMKIIRDWGLGPSSIRGYRRVRGATLASNTKSLYTNNSNPASVKHGGGRSSATCQIVWEGDSYGVIRSFPPGPRGELGHQLRSIQNGLQPAGASPVPGLDDVFELRDQDERAWYRVLFLKRIGDRLHVLHCFEKKSNRIEKRDITTARARLAAVKRRLQGEIRHAETTTRDDRGHLSGPRIRR
jgi:phage-related protein